MEDLHEITPADLLNYAYRTIQQGNKTAEVDEQKKMEDAIIEFAKKQNGQCPGFAVKGFGEPAL